MYYLLIAAAIAGGYYLYAQRKLVSLDERVKNAISQIGVQQNIRWDAITEMVRLIEKYSEAEHNLLMDSISSNRGEIVLANQAQEQQQAYGLVLEKVKTVAQEFPTLKSSELFANAMNQLNEYDNNVRMSQQVYNDIASRTNSAIRQWPNSIIAKQLGISAYDYIQVDYSKIELPYAK